MHIKSLEIKDYRNYISTNVAFGPGVNIIYGENARGKTNLIEAIYMAATSKSHRMAKENEIIRLGEKEAEVHLLFEKEGIEGSIDIHLRKNGKKNIGVNGLKIKKLSELFGEIHVIMFSPEDLGLIKNGPKERRRFIDIELSQLNPVYMYYLSHYYKVLKQRNSLLKVGSHQSEFEDLLDVYDIQLEDYGSRLIDMREKFVDELNPVYSARHYEISGGREKVTLIYDKNCVKDQLAAHLKKYRMTDIYRKTTTVGPHRDDLKFMLNDIDLRTFGSQGQQRTAALSLKLSEIEMVKDQIKDTPILLLDDVLSELDHNRQIYLTGHLENIQTFITCTGVEDFVTSNMKKYDLYEVLEGNVIKRS